jgi:hypothetical protein
VLLAGVCNPVRFVFEDSRLNNGVLTVRYPAPTSDAADIDDPALGRRILEGLDVFEFGHTLTDQLGGQLQVGLVLTNLFEDRYVDTSGDPISEFMDTFIATRAVKP